jgi:hypothetical protein
MLSLLACIVMVNCRDKRRMRMHRPRLSFARVSFTCQPNTRNRIKIIQAGDQHAGLNALHPVSHDASHKWCSTRKARIDG